MIDRGYRPQTAWQRSKPKSLDRGNTIRSMEATDTKPTFDQRLKDSEVNLGGAKFMLESIRETKKNLSPLNQFPVWEVMDDGLRGHLIQLMANATTAVARLEVLVERLEAERDAIFDEQEAAGE